MKELKGPKALFADDVPALDRFGVIVAAMKRVVGRGIWAEFGVGSGKSASWILNSMMSGEEFWLFDSWEGLPEDWQIREGLTVKKGELKKAQPNFRDPRVRYVKGWFDDTVEQTVAHWRQGISFVHVDCDLASSTKTVLEAIQPLIFPGTVFVFDELHGFDEWLRGEWQAFTRWRKTNKIVFDWIAREEPGRDALSAALVIR